MTILDTYYTYAKLAQAAYIDLSGYDRATAVLGDTAAYEAANGEPQRMSTLIAEQLFGVSADATPATTWTLLDPYYKTSAATGHSDPASGYTAMLLSNSESGKVLAIAGSEPGQPEQSYADLFSSDALQIGLLGAALKQVVSLYNHIQELRSPQGSAGVIRLEVVEESVLPWTLLPPEGCYVRTGDVIFRLEAHHDGVGRGLLQAGEKLSLTGHSLGGHVAAMAAALFPDLVTTAYTFNSPGFKGTSDNQLLFTTLGGAVPSGALTTNVIADEANVGAAPWSAIAGLNSRPGTAVNIAIENQAVGDEPLVSRPAALNHSQQTLTDALAVYATLAKLDASLSHDTFKAILNAAVLGSVAGRDTVPGGAGDDLMTGGGWVLFGGAKNDPTWRFVA